MIQHNIDSIEVLRRYGYLHTYGFPSGNRVDGVTPKCDSIGRGDDRVLQSLINKIK